MSSPVACAAMRRRATRGAALGRRRSASWPTTSATISIARLSGDVAAKPVPTIVGHWKMTIETPQGGTQEATLNFVPVDGKKLTGTMTGQFGRQQIEGEYNNGKFKFSISIAMGGQSIDVDFDGKLKNDDTLSGSVNLMSAMTMDWKATRIKDEK